MSDLACTYFCRSCFVLYDGPDGPPAADSPPLACPFCNRDRAPEALLPWMKGMCAAQHTPLTDEARAKMAEAGRRAPHPGPITEGGRIRSSANALKHGAFAKRHILPLARPGDYAACKACPFAPKTQDDEALPIGDGTCKTQNFLYCVRSAEVLVAVANAHVNQDPSILRDIIGELQGYSLVVSRDALQRIVAEGPTVASNIIRLDKDGNPVTCGTRIDPHPALRALEVLTKVAEPGLSQWNLTPHSQTEEKKADSLQDALRDLFLRTTPPPPPEKDA